MKDADYIREAVRQADGWEPRNDGAYIAAPSWCFDIGVHEVPQPMLDALAAQLVRQVDKLKPYTCYMSRAGGTAVIWPAETDQPETRIEGPDRTMNTIKAIVDSGVLE